MATKPPDFVRWTSQITQRRSFTILPDGCRDILIDRQGQVTLTDWDMQPRKITLQPGAQLTGYRLRPGIIIDKADLADIKSRDDAEALISHARSENTDIDLAISVLGRESLMINTVATRLGVSLRTLQRQFQRRALPHPEFWRMLGRARRAAIALSSDMTLTDIAGTHGYSDQAHMTRACRHWFGHTPQQIRRDAGLLSDINQPALGTWTGEHISTR